MIVVDASALMEVLLNTEAAPFIATRLFDARETLHAPHIIDLEITQVLRRYTLTGELEPARGEEMLADLGDFPLTRYPHTLFLRRIWGLRSNATAYDAAYLVLAEALGATLVTCDRALASIPGHGVHVEVLC